MCIRDSYILKTTPPPVLLARLRVQFRQQGQSQQAVVDVYKRQGPH